MSDAPETVDKPEVPKAAPEAPKRGGSLRLVVLLVILAVAASALAYDYAVARPAVQKADDLLQQVFTDPAMDPDGDGAITPEEVHQLLGVSPSETNHRDNGVIEIYRWRGGLPYKTHDLYVVYQGSKNPLLFAVSAFTPPTAAQMPQTVELLDMSNPQAAPMTIGAGPGQEGIPVQLPPNHPRAKAKADPKPSDEQKPDAKKDDSAAADDDQESAETEQPKADDKPAEEKKAESEPAEEPAAPDKGKESDGE